MATFHQARWSAGFHEPLTTEEFLSPARVFRRNPYEVVPWTPPSDWDARASEILRELGIAGARGRHVAHLSNGELRKLLLAQALLADPALLILDDPLGGMDPSSRGQVLGVLERRHREGQTLVLAAPRPEPFAALCTHHLELPGPEPPAPRPRLAVAAPPAPTADVEGAVLEVRGASVWVKGRVLLHPVELRIEPGQHWLVSGPNGAGKSTLLALISGDHPQAYANDVRVGGRRLEPGFGRSQRREQIGLMSSELASHYPGGWTLADVVRSGMRRTLGVYEGPSLVEEEALAEVLSAFGLWAQRDLRFENVSESMRRRALIARALLPKPPLLLLDEPTQGLELSARETVLRAIDETVAGGRTTLLMVSHYREERPACVSHELALCEGRVAFCGPLR
jgi:molybdate transport system ATP-binding protein